jgi:hypothetical protein
MLSNNDEYKKMGQDLSFGQLYDVQNEMKIYTGWAHSFITTRVTIAMAIILGDFLGDF